MGKQYCFGIEIPDGSAPSGNMQSFRSNLFTLMSLDQVFTIVVLFKETSS